jgi:predicted glutamine amidotransferase
MVFKGDAVPLSDLLYHPTNSLINQSHTQRRSSLIPGLPESLHMALNIDGCGLAYYDNNQQPNVYRCASAAWADAGLRELSEQAHSNLIFGHVRSASAGVTGEQAAAVGESNCHPFSYRGLSFMHNGTCNFYYTACAVL